MVNQIDVESSLFFLALAVSIPFINNMLVRTIVGGRFGLAFLTVGVARFVEGLKDSFYGVGEGSS